MASCARKNFFFQQTYTYKSLHDLFFPTTIVSECFHLFVQL